MDNIYIKNPDFIFRKISEEMLLVPLRTNTKDLCIYTLNELGARIWELLDGKRKVSEIKDKIIEEFEVDSKEAEKDLVEFLERLKEIKAIQEI